MRQRLLPLVVVMVLVAACGDDGGSDSSTTTTVVSGAVDSLQGVEGAVVRIVAQGSFVDPFEGSQGNVTGGGSGVIIDASGLALTNNHVVTGAALLEVYVGGSDEPLNARVVAVSECSDLAVIDLAGDGFPFVEWFDGEINAGLSIYAAGYPLGDPEYTLLEGIISKADAAGESTWASVDAVVEHTAETLPGNSGGPLVTANGALVGIAYAGNEAGQSFAIGRDVARPVVTQLLTGVDVESIGVNGEAFIGDTFSGTWVYSVEAGSPADITGLQAGDLIYELGRLDIGADGNLAAYCDVLRSHTATDVLDITVYRATTGEVLAGQLNGRTLEVTTTITGGDTSGLPAGTPYSGYVTITDDSGAITVDVPIEWTDIDGATWDGLPLINIAEGAGPGLIAATDVTAWLNTWEVPGVWIAASTMLPDTVDEYLDLLQTIYGPACASAERDTYDDTVYVGKYDLYTDCGGVGTTIITIIARPAGEEFTVMVIIQALTQADIDAVDRIIASYQVTTPADPEPPPGYDAYMTIFDDTGTIFMSVPAEWADVDLAFVETPTITETGGPRLVASPNRGGFVIDFSTPGIMVGAFDTPPLVDIDEYLDEAGQTPSAECTYDGRYDYDVAGFVGKFDRFDDCGGTGASVIIAYARPADEAYTLLVIGVITEDRDWEAFTEATNTLTITP